MLFNRSEAAAPLPVHPARVAMLDAERIRAIAAYRYVCVYVIYVCMIVCMYVCMYV